MIRRIIDWWWKRGTERVDLRLVPYAKSESFLKAGWQMAVPEEDRNLTGSASRMVFLELRAGPTHVE